MPNELGKTEIKRRLTLASRYNKGRITMDEFRMALGNMSQRRAFSWSKVERKATEKQIENLIAGKVSFHALTARLGVDGPAHTKAFGGKKKPRKKTSRKKPAVAKEMLEKPTPDEEALNESLSQEAAAEHTKQPKKKKYYPAEKLDLSKGPIVEPKYLEMKGHRSRVSTDEINKRIDAIFSYTRGELDFDACVEQIGLSPHHAMEWVAMVIDAPKEYLDKIRDGSLTAAKLMFAMGIRGKGRGSWRLRLQEWMRRGNQSRLTEDKEVVVDQHFADKIREGAEQEEDSSPTYDNLPDAICRAIKASGLQMGPHRFSLGDGMIEISVREDIKEEGSENGVITINHRRLKPLK